MRLGRLREQIRTHDWFGVGVELVIVVVGVLIAIQVANWNEDRLERERGREYYQRIAGELGAQIADLRSREAYYQQVLRYGERALADFERPAAQLDSQFLVALYQTSQIVVGPLTRTSYDEAVEAGDFRSVGDATLRTRLATHFDLMLPTVRVSEEAPAYRDRIRRLLPYRIQLAITEQCGDILRRSENEPPIVVLPDRCSVELGETATRRAIASVLAAPALEDDLTHYLMDLRNRIWSHATTREEAESLLALMQPPAPGRAADATSR